MVNIEKRRYNFIKHIVDRKIFNSNLKLRLCKNYEYKLIQIVEQSIIPTIANIIDGKTVCYNDIFDSSDESIWKYLNRDFNLQSIVERKLNNYIEVCIKNISEIQSLSNILSSIFQLNKEIDNISFGYGDAHKNGKTTGIVQFENGSSYIFKPNQEGKQNLSYVLDSVFKYFNEALYDNLPLKIVPSISIKDWIISPYINQVSSAKSEAEIKDFYYVIGKTLAIAVLLQFTDLHCENIIAHNGYPYIIDYETIFSITDEQDTSDSSIENTLLLQNGNERGFFSLISGIQGGEERLKSFMVPFALNDGSDEFRVSYRKLSNRKMQNRIYFNDKIVYPENYSDCIINGFTKLMNIFLKNKECVKNLILKNLNDFLLFPRVVLRPTKLYGFLIARAMQPFELKRGELYWNDIEERLKEKSINIDTGIDEIVSYELSDSKSDIIPIFYKDTHSTNLYMGNNRIVKNAFRQTIEDSLLSSLDCIDESYIKTACTKIKLLLESTKSIDYSKEIEGWIK